ncbi:YbaB/EbfC family nucleoid-associated protein [Nocardioides sp. AE5]|uniref:YbaB/EbfC family nucleoid-associated protein n=1 Tax=Nocardioides sp. AE5 TaxID=2962573 RepID=UPI002880EEBB|nr:YbaB/EbfC family nucleoid-associated protein [Nocardioides sp. AE5]MDT0202221.1 YbaB/EbfC family nucleoid-associated protein [Nocardioides sp. AE5]
MSEFDSSAAMQDALEQIEALTRATTAATEVLATVEADLVTVTMSARPAIESIDYQWAAFRGIGADELADTTRAAIAETVLKVQAAQAEALQQVPGLAALFDRADPADIDLPAEAVDAARRAASELQEREFTVAEKGGRVEVTVDGSGAITRLWLSALAGRESASEWLGEAVLSTVNAALDEARRAQEAALIGEEALDPTAELDEIVDAFEARLEGLDSRLDEVVRRLGLE